MKSVLYWFILLVSITLLVSSCSSEEDSKTASSDNTTSSSGGSSTTDTTAPTVSSVSTTADNQSSVSITDNITVTFSEAMDTTYVTTNTSDTYCSGTLRVSSDNFSTCIKMSSSPSSSNSNKTFTLDPYDNLTFSTTYKTRVTTGVKDTAGNTLSSQYETSSGFTTFSDTTAPTVSSISPTDSSYDVSFSTAIAVTFNETMSTSTITTNTDNTTCSGSFQLSSNNFATCIQMSAAPSASNSNKTFTSTPADNLSRGTNYKLQITTSAKDTSSNSLADNYTTTNGFTTYGTGTIRGTVRYDNNTAADNVSLSFAKSGTIVDNTTTADNGTYTQDNLSLGTYTISFTKSGFNDASQTAILATDNQTLIANLNLIASSCASGTISGTIKDAVSDSAVSGVSLSVRSGLNTTSGTIVNTGTTDSSGDYSLSSMSAGWYTVETSKSGYITSLFNVYACGNQADQDTSISTSIASGTMRIVLHWGTNSGLGVVDSHLTGPDNSTGRFHIYWDGKREFFYYSNDQTCSGCTAIQKSDNVSLDHDDYNGAPGTETITIPSGSWRSGTYRYSAHDYTNRASINTTIFSLSGATVKVYYNDTETTYNVPNSAGNLWTVFTIDGSSKVVTTVNGMSFQSNSTNIQ